MPGAACCRFGAFIGALTGVLLAAAPCLAQTYPAAPVKVVVPFGAGGATDILARVFSERLAAESRPAVHRREPRRRSRPDRRRGRCPLARRRLRH